ncbi:MAG: 5'-methylthioadenosine/S-adenosylhomocysteine nucleosidase [Bacteroidetes bacterium]|nr:5'-methylthioadenosine/S-adenosylhomocysteine nucleosidase [Bacteroidota bacterium]
MKTLLIIDDEFSDREGTYNAVLSDKYLIEHIKKPRDLFIEIEQGNVDCYLVDVILENWKTNGGNPQELMPILDVLKEKYKPIFLVSRQYSTLIDKSKLTPLLNEIIKKNISIESFFIWKDFEDEAFRRDKKETDIFTDTISSLIELKILQLSQKISIEENKKANIGILCALSTELQPILEHIEEQQTVKINNISFIRGLLKLNGGNEVKIVASYQEDMGTEDAAIIGSIMTREFGIKYLFMTGVCGGRDGEVNIGDIVIPNEVVAYQRGKLKDGKLIFEVGNEKSNLVPKQLFEVQCKSILKGIFTSYVNKRIELGKGTLKVEEPQLKFDQMACGANVIDTPEVLEKIATDVAKRKLCSVDMESFSIYRLNHFLDVKTLVIKSVMDLTNDKNDEYKEYASYISGNFLIEALKKGLIEL